MTWFGWLLVGLFALSIITNLVDIAQGEHTHVQKPLAHAIALLFGAFLLIGLFLWL